MLTESDVGLFRDKFILWKITVLEILMGILAVFPMIPGIADGLTFSSRFYNPVFFPILAFSSMVCGIMFIILLPLWFRAVSGSAAVELSASSICLYGISARRIQRTSILEVSAPRFGSVRLRLRGGHAISVPISFYRNGPHVLKWLRETISERKAN